MNKDKAQRGEVTGPRSHRGYIAKFGWKHHLGPQAGSISLPFHLAGWDCLPTLSGSECSEQTQSGKAMENGFTQLRPWAAHFGNHLRPVIDHDDTNIRT